VSHLFFSSKIQRVMDPIEGIAGIGWGDAMVKVLLKPLTQLARDMDLGSEPEDFQTHAMVANFTIKRYT
jgi:hypothetical protein